jgi:O-antigen ligase
LLLSFSRGAWMHFVLSAALMIVLMFVTAPTLRMRGRLIFISVVAIVAIASMLTVAMSFPSIGEMIQTRARLVQDYDVAGSTGRFTGHLASLSILLERPNGVGPLQLRNFIYGDPHQVYINAFGSYGWLGGLSYFALIVVTLVVGLRGSLMASPWQPYMIATYAAFVGEAGEGIVIDTDHWRHFYLLLGLVWGLFAATIKFRREARYPPPAPARQFR